MSNNLNGDTGQAIPDMKSTTEDDHELSAEDSVDDHAANVNLARQPCCHYRKLVVDRLPAQPIISLIGRYEEKSVIGLKKWPIIGNGR